MIRPIFETLATAILFLLAPYLYFCGTQAMLLFAYGCLPENARIALWRALPPEQVAVSVSTQQIMALGAGLLGAWIAAGLWAAYPKWRFGVHCLMSLLLLSTAAAFLEQVFSKPMIG